MTTIKATRLYNEAEAIVKEKYPEQFNYLKRAIEIENLLSKLHGEDIADEILELVFQNEIM